MQHILVILFSAISALAAHHGPGDGGGGDETGLEFVASFRSAQEIIQLGGVGFADLARLDWTKIGQGMKAVAVDRKLYVMIKGKRQDVVAVNHPDTMFVEVNRARWASIHEPHVREGIALHEALSLARLEATGVYPYSGLYLSLFSVAPGPVLGGEAQPGRAAPWPSQVSKIYPYHCKRTFFEGEGVTASNVNCVGGQHLGLLTADYTFYLYAMPLRNNFSSKLSEVFFPSDVCGIRQVHKFECDMEKEPAFGLSAESEGPFVVGISLTAAPVAVNDQPLSANYGFAALPDSTGHCAPNLVEARPWIAQPGSVTDPLPSSFMNTGNLNDTVVSVGAPAAFEVWRQPNSVPCNSFNGACTMPQGGFQLVQSVPYYPLTPRVCVIPKGALQ